MAEDDRASPSPKNEVSEDAETRAARRELKQSSISDPAATTTADETAQLSSSDDKVIRPETPTSGDTTEGLGNDCAEQVLSPKKKRAHDQLDVGKDYGNDDDVNSVASTDSAKDRTMRLEPEKKRHRDGEQSQGKPETQRDKDQQPADKAVDAVKAPPKLHKQTSASAFTASSFGKLTGASSPFANLSGASKNSVFGSSANTTSSFASATASSGSSPSKSASTVTEPPKLTFGGAGGGLSPFAGLSSASNGFANSSAFGSAMAGAKPLQSFAAPGSKPLLSEKPGKPFGAPDSDVESEADDDENGSENTTPEEAERSASPEKDLEEKKKTKLQKVEVDDGEAGETTVASVRAKMFYHGKEAGWKERGAGMLKINVPQACVDLDDSGVAIPGSFDASELQIDDDDNSTAEGRKVCRLIMRQDQTHRVILNTALVPAMKFQEKASLKSVGILFTAFEGEHAKPVAVTMRMSAANAKMFMNEIDAIQRELRGN